MPVTSVVFFKEVDGSVPVAEWMLELGHTNRKAFLKCAARLERLREMGYELRRPEVDLLRNGIYELRARFGTVQYRILYFFHGRQAAVLTHAITKEQDIPSVEIDLALKRMRAFVSNPQRHTHIGEVP